MTIVYPTKRLKILFNTISDELTPEMRLDNHIKWAEEWVDRFTPDFKKASKLYQIIGKLGEKLKFSMTHMGEMNCRQDGHGKQQHIQWDDPNHKNYEVK